MLRLLDAAAAVAFFFVSKNPCKWLRTRPEGNIDDDEDRIF